MRLKDIHHYDTYVPILSDLDQKRTWQQAVDTVLSSLAPLGNDYVSVLARGLTTDRWCDRYPNRGKQSGAFSSGSASAGGCPPVRSYRASVIRVAPAGA